MFVFILPVLRPKAWTPVVIKKWVSQFDRQEASITWCDLFRPKFGQKMPKISSLHDVLEPLKQALSASRDVVISSLICGSNLQKKFTLGDGCWLPIWPICNALVNPRTHFASNFGPILGCRPKPIFNLGGLNKTLRVVFLRSTQTPFGLPFLGNSAWIPGVWLAVTLIFGL